MFVFLKNGIPLSNSISVVLLQKELAEAAQRGEVFITGNLRYRKKEVLKKELEALKQLYESLRLSLRKAEENKVSLSKREQLKQTLERFGKTINRYEKMFAHRLVS